MDVVRRPDPPSGLRRALWRLPVHLYRAGLGRLLGGRLMLLTHVGRVSGRLAPGRHRGRRARRTRLRGGLRLRPARRLVQEHREDAGRRPPYDEPALAEAGDRLEASLAGHFGGEKFVTAIVAEVHDGEILLLNCGHPAPC
ncbi:hypothetical protein [Nonomuraea pusilla]|uniref:Uncharacterized protein n=1 Tax=Nonomuraea pusilla TaxID=46177 RepID=A0A1H7HZ53_9ACTN|nr:hypothetical protein [Nonomuraea pusilla]SEK55561.1 hypothetical protein SAMN05660976_00636 [Nonomuraea pusilla]